MAKRKGKNIEDTNRVIRSHKNKGEQTAKWPKEKGKTLRLLYWYLHAFLLFDGMIHHD
jgi:hypothetical protein